MARFALVGPSYTSQSVTADAQKCLNFYPEQLDTNSKSSMALYPTAGLSFPVWGLAGPSVRGMITADNRLFAVSGGILYELFAAGPINLLANIANDNKPVSMAIADLNPTSVVAKPQLAVVSAGILYVVDLNTNTVTIAAGAQGTPFQVAYADGFFVLLNTNGVFQVSAPLDATTWPGINSAVVTIYGDQTIAMATVHREIFFMSPTHGAVYGDTGATPVPFEVVTGGDFEQGIAAPWSMIRLDNTMFWLGANEDGAGVVWRASGYTPQRVSNHAVEYAMQGYPTLTDAIAYGYQDQGHTFYVIYFPSANNNAGATWVFDVATNMWHEKAFLTSSGTYTAHRSQCHVYAFGKHYVGDWNSGSIYQQSINFTQDFGNPIKRLRRAPHLATENEWVFYDQLQVDVETGLTPSQILLGPSLPTFFNFADGSGGFWNMWIDDLGILNSGPAGNIQPGTLFINDPANTTSWEITVNDLGIITTTAALFTTYPIVYPMISSTGLTSWNLMITDVGVLQTFLTGATATRNPQLVVRMSRDYGHTWGNPRYMDCGAPGEFKKRAIIRRLGRARDMVFEISTTDPIPWRIVDGYLKASPGYEPTQRITDRVRSAA